MEMNEKLRDFSFRMFRFHVLGAILQGTERGKQFQAPMDVHDDGRVHIACKAVHIFPFLSTKKNLQMYFLFIYPHTTEPIGLVCCRQAFYRLFRYSFIFCVNIFIKQMSFLTHEQSALADMIERHL
jgi:hypothetical protein